MQKLLCIIVLLVAFSSCKNSWPQEDKDLFYDSCLEDANTWAGSPANAKAICTCRMEKIMKKYPDEGDALEHMDSLMHDPDLAACKDEVLNKK